MSYKEKSFFFINDVFNYLLCEESKPKIKKYKDTKKQNESCPITLNKFFQNTEVAELLCGHCFESNALQEWLNKQRVIDSTMSCPLCRDKLKINIERTIKEFVKKLIIEEDKQLQEIIYNSLSKNKNKIYVEDISI